MIVGQINLDQLLDCAPSIDRQTMAAIVRVESGGNALAIKVNGAPSPAPATSKAQAVSTAFQLIAAGYSVDLGVAQINSRNLRWLGLAIEDAFDPCANLAAAARVLSLDYSLTRRQFGDGQAALSRALSRYNTGSDTRGFANGYVGRVYHAAASLAVQAARPENAYVARPPAAPLGGALAPPFMMDAASRPSFIVFLSSPVEQQQ